MKKITSVVLAATLATSVLSTTNIESFAAAKSVKVKNGKLVDNKGKKVKGYKTYKGVLYKDGKKFKGVYKGKFYSKGSLASGTYKGVKYRKGNVFTGKSIVDGKYYSVGGVANGVATNGLTYNNGVLLTGVIDGIIYENGVAQQPVSEENKDENQSETDNTNTPTENEQVESPVEETPQDVIPSTPQENTNTETPSVTPEYVPEPPIYIPSPSPTPKPEPQPSVPTYSLVDGDLYIDKDTEVYYVKNKYGKYDVASKAHAMTNGEDKVLLFDENGKLDETMTNESYDNYYMADILLGFYTSDNSTFYDVNLWEKEKQDIFNRIDKVSNGKYKTLLLGCTVKAQEIYDRTRKAYEKEEVNTQVDYWKQDLLEKLDNPEAFDERLRVIDVTLSKLEYGDFKHPFREVIKQLEIDYPDAKVFNRDKVEETEEVETIAPTEPNEESEGVIVDTNEDTQDNNVSNKTEENS